MKPRRQRESQWRRPPFGVIQPEKIDAVAPEMPDWIRRWFLERNHGKPSIKNQDFDLSLAEWAYVPLLVEFCEDEGNVLEKRFTAFSALMVLQRYEVSGQELELKVRLNEEIRRLVIGNPDFAHRICDGCLGLPDALIIKSILGEAVSDEYPGWIQDEVTRRTDEINGRHNLSGEGTA